MHAHIWVGVRTMHIYVRVCTYVHIYAVHLCGKGPPRICAHTHIHIPICTRMYEAGGPPRLYVYTDTYMHIYARASTRPGAHPGYIYIYAHICMYAHICTRIYEARGSAQLFHVYMCMRPGGHPSYLYTCICTCPRLHNNTYIYDPARVDWTPGRVVYTECHGASFTLAWVGVYIHAMA